MNLDKYESLVRSKGMSPLDKKKVGEYDVYISEGFSRADTDHNEPHYKTMYAYGKDGEVYVGEFFTTPILNGSTKEKRIKETIERATEMMAPMKEAGCLK